MFLIFSRLATMFNKSESESDSDCGFVQVLYAKGTSAYHRIVPDELARFSQRTCSAVVTVIFCGYLRRRVWCWHGVKRGKRSSCYHDSGHHRAVSFQLDRHSYTCCDHHHARRNKSIQPRSAVCIIHVPPTTLCCLPDFVPRRESAVTERAAYGGAYTPWAVTNVTLLIIIFFK